MKTMLALLLACSGILTSTVIFAFCDSCYESGASETCYSTNSCDSCAGDCYINPCCAFQNDNCNYSTGCDNGCGETSSCDPCGDSKYQYAYGCERPCDCNCTDNGWRYNNCVSKCEYCEAFGNIGAR